MKKKILIAVVYIVSIHLIFNLHYLYSRDNQENKIRVIKEKAELKLQPNSESLIIKILPLGSIFTIEDVSEDWIKIKLPPNQDRIIVTGYIHRSAVDAGNEQHFEEKKVLLHLKDGSIIHGNILDENESKISIESILGTLNIERAIIQEIERLYEINKFHLNGDNKIIEGDVVPLEVVDVTPVLIKSVTPKYEWRKFYAGSVKFILEVLISENGDIENAIIIGGVKAYEPVRKVLMDAVRQWKYEPALKSGVRVKVWKEETIRINID